MFYRKKILLNLLNAFGGKLDKILFSKLLFLFSMSDNSRPHYEFVPYKYGAFSFTAYSDINKMEKDGIIISRPKLFVLKQFDRQLHKITSSDSEKIEDIHRRFHNKNTDELMKITYKLYPYYAKNSTKQEFLSRAAKKEIEKTILKHRQTTMFDIGYEGKSLEAYFNLLIKNDIKTLIDVRKNPISRKYGFSKSTLSKTAGSLGIEYIHMPELGIESYKRQNLNSFKDYQKLFKNYEMTTLKQNIKSVKKIYHILTQNKKAALTCFEADKNYCHRYRIVNFMKSMYPDKFATEHLSI
jgi:uncharacterized protein (DUF488 family)